MVRAKGRRCDAMARRCRGEIRGAGGDPLRRSEAARSEEIAAPVERSEVPLCEVPMDKTGWARWLCVCALCCWCCCVAASAVRARARGLLYFCRKR